MPRHRQGLSEERITIAAQRLLERDGVARFSMRRLGSELGVEAMTLYHYFPSKDAVLESVLAKFADELTVLQSGDWETLARSFAIAFRDAASRAPATAQLLLLRPPPASAVAKSQAVLAGLVDGGLDPSTALLAYRTLSAYTWGSLVEDQRSPPFACGTRDEEFRFGLDAIVTGVKAARP